MTDERLAEIEARAEAAIPGPWTVRLGSNGYVHQIGIDAGGLRDPIGCAYGENAQGRENAEMMARAREDLPALCRALREERAARQEAVHLLRLAVEDASHPSATRRFSAITANAFLARFPEDGP